MGVECYRLDGLLDLEIDVAVALVGPWFAGLEVGERDGVVGGLDTADTVSDLSIRLSYTVPYSCGRMSRSDAILINELEA